MLQRVTELYRHEAEIEIEVVERHDTPGAWSVEAIESDGDGAVYQATFVGPEAESRAREYAAFKYDS